MSPQFPEEIARAFLYLTKGAVLVVSTISGQRPEPDRVAIDNWTIHNSESRSWAVGGDMIEEGQDGCRAI